MSVIVVGLNHRTAPVSLRERLALNGDRLEQALRALHQVQFQEVTILSTCNRLEIYAYNEHGSVRDGWATLETYMAELQDMSLKELRPAFYYFEGEKAVHHLMRVSAGLDSMILGEPQILGQVNTAYTKAHTLKVTGPTLSRLFTQAVHAGKRARTETDISRYTTSVSHAAVRLAQAHVKDLTKAKALVVGAGEMAALAADALLKHKTGTITFINRTQEHADSLAEQLGVCTRHWHQLLDTLVETDFVITSTGAPHVVIHEEAVREVMAHRAGRPLLFIDIAVPRDIEEAVGEIEGVICYDIDHLQHVLDDNMAQREASAQHVESIIQQDVSDFMAWYQSREVAPVIAELRRKAAEIAQAEVQLALNRLNELSPHEQKVIDRLANRIINKILHEPTVRLKEQAVQGNGNYYADVLAELFDLETSSLDMMPNEHQPMSILNHKIRANNE